MSAPDTHGTIPAAWLHADRLARVREQLRANLPSVDRWPLVLKELCGQENRTGVVWMLDDSRSLGIVAEQNFVRWRTNSHTEQSRDHQQLLIETLTASTAHLALQPFSAIKTSHVLLVPIRRNNRPCGVLELFLDEQELDWEACRAQLEELTDSLNVPATPSNAKPVDRFLASFSQFSTGIHESLEPRKMARFAADEMRVLLNVDRVTILKVTGRSCRALACSGQSRVNRRSSQIRNLEHIAYQVQKTGRRFLFPHGDDPLPESLMRVLSDYLQESSTQMFLVDPVPEWISTSQSDQPPHKSRIRHAIVCEQFQNSVPTDTLLQRLGACREQLRIAAHNAQRYSRLRRIPGLNLLGHVWQGLTFSRSLLTACIVLLMTLAAWGLLSLERPYMVDCRGVLVPALRRNVYSPMDGHVTAVRVRESQRVQAGEVLLELTSPELTSRLLDAHNRLRQKSQEQNAVRADLRRALAQAARAQSAQLQAQSESLSVEIQTLHELIALLEEQQRQLTVVAPISGTVTTTQLEVRLKNKPVRRGEPLLEMMAEDGQWELELDVPEHRIGHLAFEEAKSLPVEYRLLSAPDQARQTILKKLGDRTVETPLAGPTVKAWCPVDVRDLEHARIGMDVVARIETSQRSLLYLCFGDFYEYLQRNWWLPSS